MHSKSFYLPLLSLCVLDHRADWFRARATAAIPDTTSSKDCGSKRVLTTLPAILWPHQQMGKTVVMWRLRVLRGKYYLCQLHIRKFVFTRKKIISNRIERQSIGRWEYWVPVVPQLQVGYFFINLWGYVWVCFIQKALLNVTGCLMHASNHIVCHAFLSLLQWLLSRICWIVSCWNRQNDRLVTLQPDSWGSVWGILEDAVGQMWIA